MSEFQKNKIPSFDEVMNESTGSPLIPSFADIMGEEQPVVKKKEPSREQLSALFLKDLFPNTFAIATSGLNPTKSSSRSRKGITESVISGSNIYDYGKTPVEVAPVPQATDDAKDRYAAIEKTNREETNKKINQVGQSIFSGNITGQELSDLYESPYGKEVVENVINKYAPDLGTGALGKDVFRNEVKWDLIAKEIKTKTRPDAVAAQDAMLQRADEEIRAMSQNYQLVSASASGGGGGAGFSFTQIPLGDIDTKNKEALSEALLKLKSADYLVGSDGRIVKGLKEHMIESVATRLQFLNANEPIDEEITALNDKIKQAVVTNIISSDRAREKDDTQSSLEDDEIKNQQFQLGLNYVKDENPAIYKNVIRAIQEKGQVPETNWRYISRVGQDIYNLKNFRNAAADPNLIDKETDYDYLTYQDKKSMYASAIGEYLKEKGFTNYRVFPKELIKETARKIGLTNADIVNDLAEEEGILFYDAIPKSGGREAFARGFMTPLEGIKNTVDKIEETDVETYARTQQYDVGFGQKVAGADGAMTKELSSDRGNVWYDALEGFGQFVPQVLLTRGIGAPLTSAARTAMASAAPRAALTAAQAANVTNYGGTFISAYLQAYGNAYDEALEKTGDPKEARAMGAINGIVEAGTELFLPDTKIADRMAGLFRGKYSSDIISLLKKGGNPVELAREGRTVIGKMIQETLSIGGQEVSEELANNMGNYITESIFNPKTAADRDLMAELGETAKATAISMLIPSILGGGGSAVSMSQDFTVSGLHSAAANFTDYKNALDKAAIEDRLTVDERDTGIQLLATHRNNMNRSPETSASGKSISRSERLEFAYQQTQIDYLNKKLEENNSEVAKEDIKAKIQKAQDVQREILGEEPKEGADQSWKKRVQPIEEEISQPVELDPNLPEGFQAPVPVEPQQPDQVELTEAEQAAVEGLSGKDFSSNQGIKVFTDVLQSAEATPAQKKDALRSISDQLTAPSTAADIGQTLGKDAELIYNLGYPETQEGEELQEVIRDEETQDLSEEDQQRFDEVQKEIDDLGDLIDAEGGLNARIQEAEEAGNTVRANNLRMQRDDTYKKMLEKEREKQSILNPKEKPAKESMVGTIIQSGGRDFEVVEDRGDKVAVFNPDTNATLVVDKASLPQPRQIDPQIMTIMDRLGVEEADAIELQTLLESGATRDEFKEKVTEIKERRSNLGASQADIIPDIELGDINEEDYDAILAATNKIIGDNRPELGVISTRTVERSVQQLEESGGVVWQEFPNGQRLDSTSIGDPGGTQIDGTQNVEYRSGQQGTNRLLLYGLGQYDDSGEQSVAGKTLVEIISGEGYSDKQRGMAAALLSAQRLLFNPNTGFIGKLFKRAANPATSARGNIRIVYDERPGAGLINSSSNGTIIINAARLGQRLKEFGGEKKFADWLENALIEEAVHLSSFKVATEKDFKEVHDEMTPEQRSAVAAVYGREVSDMTPVEIAGEYVRQIIQERITGTTTELLKPAASRIAVKRLLAKLVSFIKNTFKGSDNPKAKEVVRKIEDFINDRESTQSTTPTLKATVSLFERPDLENPVYKVKIGDKEFFVQKQEGMNPSDTAWYQVVKRKDGFWHPPKGPAGVMQEGWLGYTRQEAISNLLKQEGGEQIILGTSDEDIDDIYNQFNKRKNKPRVRFSKEQWLAQLSDEEQKRYEKEQSYQYGFAGPTGSGEKALDGYQVRRRDSADKIFGTELSFQVAFDQMISEDRYAEHFDMLEDGKDMIGIAQNYFGGSDVSVYGSPLVNYIQRMSDDKELRTKKIILMGTLLGEMKNHLMRGGANSQIVRRDYERLFRYYRDYMNLVGRDLSAGKIVLFFRDKYMADLFADKILNEQELKDLNRMKERPKDEDPKNEEVSDHEDNTTAGKSQEDVNESLKQQQQNRQSKKKKDDKRKKGSKSDYQRAAKAKEDEIKKKHGSNQDLVSKIIDAIKKLNCK